MKESELVDMKVGAKNMIKLVLGIIDIENADVAAKLFSSLEEVPGEVSQRKVLELALDLGIVK